MVKTQNLWYTIYVNNEEIIDELALESAAKHKFGVAIEINKIIARNFPVGASTYATLFLSKKNHLYCYIYGSARHKLGEISKICNRIGIKPEIYFPPNAQVDYFNRLALEKFNLVFPGFKHPTDNDLRYYRTLVPYSPALIKVGEIKNGVIYCADSDAKNGWRPFKRLSYSHIYTVENDKSN